MALAIIWVSVGVGVLLAFWQRGATRATGPIRTFAVVAAGLVVALSLLPHAIASEGLAGLAVATASVAIVPGLERLVRVPFRNVDAEGLRLELGFAGLMVHRFGDGVVMAVDGHGIELSWAVGAHEIPIVALVTMAYARRGLPTALLRAAMLGLASSLGYWLVRSMPGTWHGLHGWVDAIAAGILVHILAYEALPERLETARARAFDVLGALLGFSIVLLPSGDAHEGEGLPSVAQSLLRGSLDAAPLLVLGLTGSVLWMVHRPPTASAGLRIGIARPWPGVEAFTLAARSLGWLATSCYLLAASALAMLARVLVQRVATTAGGPGTPLETAPSEVAPSLWSTLEALVLRVGGWIALGLLAQSYIESFLPGSTSLAVLDPAPRTLLGLVIAAAAAICTAGAVPIAAALVAKGLPPAVVLLGLVLGPVLSNTVNVQRRAGVGVARALLTAGLLGFAALALAPWLPELPPAARSTTTASPGVVEWIALAALGAVVVKSIWRVGVRGWLGSSLRSFGSATRRHVHAH
jgi:hypothetical protein